MNKNRAKAERIDREQRELDKMASLAAKQVGPALMKAALQANRVRNGQVRIGDVLKKVALDSMAMTMMAAHLTGYNRVFQLAKDDIGLAGLNLSAATDAISFFRKRYRYDMDALEKMYQTQALRVVNGVTEAAESKLDSVMEQIISEGLHVDEGVDRLGEAFDSLGLTPRNSYQLENIFRTQVQISYSGGKYAAEQSPEIQEILWGYTYVTVGDDRVRPEHEAMDGTTLPKDDPFWASCYPPNGWSCRCTAIPLFEEVSEVLPPSETDDGDPVVPDKGFDINFGAIYAMPALVV
jgi:SPP1 gp7 family putative phage head morphogenesis protein